MGKPKSVCNDGEKIRDHFYRVNDQMFDQFGSDDDLDPHVLNSPEYSKMWQKRQRLTGKLQKMIQSGCQIPTKKPSL